MTALLQRSCLALLVLLASAAPRQALAQATPRAEDTIGVDGGDHAVVPHHELVRAPSAHARALFPSPVLRPLLRALTLPVPRLGATVHVASARARRAFTRPRVRRFRPSDPDDF